MFTSLLVGLDGSPLSLIALNQAIHIGRRFRSQIILVHVARAESLAGFRPQWIDPASDQAGSSEDQSARALLDGAADTVRRAGLTVRTELVAAMWSRRCGSLPPRWAPSSWAAPVCWAPEIPWVRIPAS